MKVRAVNKKCGNSVMCGEKIKVCCYIDIDFSFFDHQYKTS